MSARLEAAIDAVGRDRVDAILHSWGWRGNATKEAKLGAVRDLREDDRLVEVVELVARALCRHAEPDCWTTHADDARRAIAAVAKKATEIDGMARKKFPGHDDGSRGEEFGSLIRRMFDLSASQK